MDRPLPAGGAAAPHGRRVTLVVLAIATAAAAAFAIYQRPGSHKPSPAGSSSSASWIDAGPYGTGHGDELPVFATPRTAGDVLPLSIFNFEQNLSARQPDGMGLWRAKESRRILAVGTTALYVWPIGKNGLCTAMTAGTVGSAGCRPSGPSPHQLRPLVHGSSGGRAFLGGVVGRDVVGLTVDAPGLACRVDAARSGFLCTGPAASRTVTAQLRLRNGHRTRTVRIG